MVTAKLALGASGSQFFNLNLVACDSSVVTPATILP